MAVSDNVHAGHRERLRKRIQSEGLCTLEPHEVIEFLLCYALPRQDVNAVAHRLIETFGTVTGVLTAPVEELRKVSGIGERAAAILVQIGKTVDVCRQTDIEDRISMRRFTAVLAELRSYEKCVRFPAAYLMCLDMDKRLLYRCEISASFSWGEPETLRKVIADILTTRARYAVIALYGSHELAPYDAVCARELAYVLHECGVTLLDVIALSDHGYHSMQYEGLMPGTREDAAAAALRKDYLQNDMN